MLAGEGTPVASVNASAASVSGEAAARRTACDMATKATARTWAPSFASGAMLTQQLGTLQMRSTIINRDGGFGAPQLSQACTLSGVYHDDTI